VSKISGWKLPIVFVSRFERDARIEPLLWSMPLRKHGAPVSQYLEYRSRARRAVLAAWWRAWPPAALAIAVIVDMAWITLLGYGIAKAALG
jgi:hypothetical protein